MTFEEIQAMLDNAGTDCDGSKVDRFTEKELLGHNSLRNTLYTPLGYYKPAINVLNYLKVELKNKSKRNLIYKLIKEDPENYYLVDKVPTNCTINRKHKEKFNHPSLLCNTPLGKSPKSDQIAFFKKNYVDGMTRVEIGDLFIKEYKYKSPDRAKSRACAIGEELGIIIPPGGVKKKPKTCEHCGRHFTKAMYDRWHGDNCKNRGNK